VRRLIVDKAWRRAAASVRCVCLDEIARTQSKCTRTVLREVDFVHSCEAGRLLLELRWYAVSSVFTASGELNLQ
jgi:hypothetical protein